MKVNFYYKIPSHNINKIFATDFLLSKATGYDVKNASYDFNTETRKLTYECKYKNFKKLISNAMKSGIKDLTFDSQK